MERKARNAREHRALPEDGYDDRVRYDASQDGRNQGVGFEAVLVQYLHREQRRTERRPEYGRDTRRHPRDEQDATLARADSQHLGDERAERAADLHRWPLAATGTTGAQREHGRQRLQ